jgi:hypothetical protein
MEFSPVASELAGKSAGGTINGGRDGRQAPALAAGAPAVGGFEVVEANPT